MIAALRRGAEAVLVGMMAVMFIAFILQVVFRYVLNWPVGWTDELCTLVWLWGILWGASFVMTNREVKSSSRATGPPAVEVINRSSIHFGAPPLEAKVAISEELRVRS